MGSRFGRWALGVACMLCTGWWKANFHGHCAGDVVGDDGSETPAELHAALAARGFHFSAHTPHSTLATGAGAPDKWRRQREAEARLSPGITVAVGQELTVAPGPRFRDKTEVLGHAAPGNLDHVSLIGASRFVPSGTALAEACRAVHASGGICIVNHPGPGPLMWEEGLWEAPANRGLVDALEVYNGQAFAATGIDFEARYLEATSYRGLGMKIAAVTGADTHGPASVKRAQGTLARFGKAAALVAAMAPPASPSGRTELEAATLVDSPSPSVADVVAAVRARRTIATWGMGGDGLRCDGLGEVRRSRDVKLALDVGRKVAAITLYREGEPVRTWNDVAAVEFAETIARPAAYVFGVRDRTGRMLTSAIWYEP